MLGRLVIRQSQREQTLPQDQMKIGPIHGVVLGVLMGIAIGVGVYTFAYAQGWSYLTDDPAACANCHVMREQFDGWLKSSHRSVATCNNCHTPANFIGKYTVKASNGFWHSFFFTTGGYEDNIQIKPHSREITEQACRNCHGEIVDAIEATHPASSSGQLACLRCHNSVGHLQ